MNRCSLFHVTEFSYDGPVSESYNEVRLRPRQDETQSCLSFRLTTDPVAKTSAYLDPYGNWVHRFNVLPEHRHLRVEADSVVLVQEPRPLPEDGLALRDLAARAEALDEFYDLLCATVYVPHLPAVRELAGDAERDSGGSVAGFARAAAALVHDGFRYEKGATHVQSSIEDALRTRSGVCQDFAHLLLAMLRMHGLPARYVSGYLLPKSTTEPGASTTEVIGGQASHAWTEVYLPDEGWFGLDPTLGEPIGLRHVRVAYGRDYGDVAPVRGVYKGHAGQRLSVDVRVRPALDEEGNEHLQETAAGPVQAPAAEEPPQQQQQQQQ
ncbi:MAG: transglutaminase family protein [Bryobacteraceae bacterium]|jgi:transglutaminase-like putative cysteine protease